MPKINLNVVIVCGSTKVDLTYFTELITESYRPNVQVQQQNGCTLTRTLVTSQQTAMLGDLISDHEQYSSANNGLKNQQTLENFELDICFWDMNPKEHLWSRLKALQLYEQANIFIMLYNADDKDSFEKLVSIHNDFNEQNQVGAYQVLVAIVNKDIANKSTRRIMKNDQIQDFLEQRGIPSFIECRLDNKKNVDLLDYHLRFIMNPAYNEYRTKKETAFLYRPLFQTLQNNKKKKNPKEQVDWVDRLYYLKPDYARLYKQRQKVLETTFNANSSQYKSSRIYQQTPLESSPPFNISITNERITPPQKEHAETQRQRPSHVPRHSVIDLQINKVTKEAIDKPKTQDLMTQDPGYESDQNNNNHNHKNSNGSNIEIDRLSKEFWNQPLRNVIDKKYLQTMQTSLAPPSPNNQSKIQRDRSFSTRLNKQFQHRSNPNLLLTCSADMKYSPNRESTKVVEKLKNQVKKSHAQICPYHARHSRSRSPRSTEEKVKPYPELNSYMSKNKTRKSLKPVKDSKPKISYGARNVDIDLLQLYSKDYDQFKTKLMERDQRIQQELKQQDNFYVAPSKFNKSQMEATLNISNLNNKGKIQAMTGVNMTEEQKMSYFKKLQQNYQNKGGQTHNTSSQSVPNLQKYQTDQSYLRYNGSNNYVHKNNHEKVYISRDFVPVEQHYHYKPEKDRGYGCNNCSIF
ncbi:UNKNOWN [Stylonychia lemnae]|uniref:Uncharacterized protein n=1 Tax=Stylonychia lemnae TaxID=5949 RepID=A0A078A5X4_STYLE|nr:UNKNOWN [Stylonychia lemnae]|eukprot:CDW76159.1 UNKNOWN [Stylonychia lemnae]